MHKTSENDKFDEVVFNVEVNLLRKKIFVVVDVV